jgi:hypothetical protein
MLANVSDVRVTQTARVNMNGQVTPIHQVQYNIAGQGPFRDSFDDAHYTPENVQNAQVARMVQMHRIGVPMPVPPQPVAGSPGSWAVPHVPPPIFDGGLPPAPVPTEPVIWKEPRPESQAIQGMTRG